MMGKPMTQRVVALVLAGGKGSRLEPLTRDRAKPAVPFGGAYRIIDFTLSNCINSGLRQILVLTQFKSASLDRHLNRGWNFLSHQLQEYINILPPQQRLDSQWYQGTADAVYQNIYSIEQANSEYIVILSGDHIYKMDYADLIQDHIQSQAVLTIGCIPCSIQEGREFGVMQIDEDRRIIDFEEKPENPKPIPHDPTRCLASMGIYVFNTKLLFDQLCRDATEEASQHDFGKNIIPRLIHSQLVRAYPFQDKRTGRSHYWRDVGTLDAFYEANMDLVAVEPELNLYDRTWPLRTYIPQEPPPKFVFSQTAGVKPRLGQALDSLVCSGSILSGGTVRHSILGYHVRINSWATVEDSILFDGVEIGRNCRIRRAIIDKHVRLPEGSEVGYNHDQDRAQGYVVTDSGIVVISKADGYA